jgi:hypothetical protein
MKTSLVDAETETVVLEEAGQPAVRESYVAKPVEKVSSGRQLKLAITRVLVALFSHHESGGAHFLLHVSGGRIFKLC